MNKRLLGIDYGTVRVGLALSDLSGMLAGAYKTLQHKGKDMHQIAAEIHYVAEKEDVGGIVLGLPRRTDGKVGEKEEQVRLFASILEEETGLPIVFIDERFTTRIAHQYLNDSGIRKSKKRDVVDQLAAQIFLQDYLDKTRGKGTFF